MIWTKKIACIVAVVALLVGAAACTVSYKFSGTSIDYSKVKTISIVDFPIKAEYVYAPLATRFNEELKDAYLRQTRLKLVNRNADMEIEGEITGYNQYNQAVQADGYSSQTKLTVTVNVRFVNNTDHSQDFDNQQFSAFRVYESTKLLTEVQDQLIGEMTKEIVDQIFNATVALW